MHIYICRYRYVRMYVTASEFLYTKNPVLEGSSTTNTIVKDNPEMLSPTHYQCHVVKISRKHLLHLV